MFLPTKDGVACDECGVGSRHDFVYYSFDFRAVDVYNNRRPALDQILHQPIIFSTDVCAACYHKHATAVVANYNKIISPQRRVRPEIVCELSGAVLAGTYTYYYAVVTKVTVRTTGQARCINCQTPTTNIQVPCVKCAGRSFQQVITTVPEPRHLEINLSEAMYKALTTTAATVRKVAGEWMTTST